MAALAVTLAPGGAAAQRRTPRPPPTSSHYIQYGAALSVESVADAGDVCPSGAVAPCILGSGLGPVIRLGYRTRGPWYVGGAYEFSRQDSSNLLRLAILQQLRAEARWYAPTGSRIHSYLTGTLGAALYGNEWGTDTGGVTTSMGAGLEVEASRTTVITGALSYRALVLRGWTDGADQRRADRYLGFGFAHFVTLEVGIEARSPLARW